MPRRRAADAQLPLPGVLTRSGRKRKIFHKKILQKLSGKSPAARGLASIYCEEVLPIKTRTIRLPGHKSPARIMNTLLGYEVKSAYGRLQCPDLVTARYLKLFAELGCRSIRLPYDPTVTARLIPSLEAELDHINLGVRAQFPKNRTLQLYVLRRIYHHIRRQLQKPPAAEPKPTVQESS